MKNLLPRPWRRSALWVFRSSQDFVDHILGHKDKSIPPRRLMEVGDGDFRQVGQEFFGYFTALGGLKPGDRVLDIGSGIGRIAIPLTKFLNTNGSYEGVEIVKQGVRWCSRNITSINPNFRFHFADIYNYSYNPHGKLIASEYRFPFEDRSFDFVFLTSVFTHMLPDDVENYLSEINRLLKRGGRCFATFFLLNSESQQLIHGGQSSIKFGYTGNGFRAMDPTNLEAAVAYDEKSVVEMFEKRGLFVTRPVYYGKWCGRKNFLSYQDVIIAEKNDGNVIRGTV